MITKYAFYMECGEVGMALESSWFGGMKISSFRDAPTHWTAILQHSNVEIGY